MDKLKLFILNYKKTILSIIIIILIIILTILSINKYNEYKEKNKITETKDIIVYEDEIENKEEIVEKKEIKIENKEEIQYIYIDIKGEVKKPNVYKVNLLDNRRVIDIINLAGGLTNKAYTKNINMSLKVFDEMVIIVNSIEEVTIKEEIKKEEEKINDTIIKEENNENKLININLDPIEELIKIPGISESKAKDIINYRNENKFNTIEDILNVNGIGEKTYEKLKDYITV